MKNKIFLFVPILMISSLLTIFARSELNNSNFIRDSYELLNSRAIKLIIPRYTAEARKARIQGIVLVHIEVNQKGVVTEARMIEGDHLLKEVSEKAALASILKPKIANGKKVKYSGIIQYTFSIKD